jgi:hypothetical protein
MSAVLFGPQHTPTFLPSNIPTPAAKKTAARRRSRSWSFLEMPSPGRFHFLLQPVTACSLQTLFSSNSSPRSFPVFDQVLQTMKPSHSRFTTDLATPIPVHSQLVLSLPGKRQVHELIFDCFRHLGAGIEQPLSDPVKFQLCPG